MREKESAGLDSTKPNLAAAVAAIIFCTHKVCIAFLQTDTAPGNQVGDDDDDDERFGVSSLYRVRWFWSCARFN